MKLDCKMYFYKEVSHFLAICVLLNFSCNTIDSNQDSYWSSQKEEFRFSRLNEFVVDSLLEKEINSFAKRNHKSLDSIFPSEKVYLYSWQDSDRTKNEFTVVKDRGELGLKIYYLIMDKEDKLISVTDIAGAGREAYHLFETTSKFISRDTILQVRTVTQWIDLDKQERLSKTKADSIFLYLIIDSSGGVIEKVFKEVKQLNFMSD